MKHTITIGLLGFLLASCAGQQFKELGNEPELSPMGSGMRYSDTSQMMYYPKQPAKRINQFSLWSDHKSALFQDTRAMSVGDILTVDISINDRASFANGSDRTRSSSTGINADGSLRTIFGTITGGPSDLSLGSNSTATGDGSTTRSEQLQIRVAAVVTGILENGNLVISGSQEVRLNYELRILNVAGIVRPKDIDTNNMVAYEKMAEARISYGGRGRLTEVQQPPVGQQFVDKITPF